jgi:3-oxoacid CoA-transferase B subunit
MPPLTRDQVAKRAARELSDGMYVNLGIGMPTLVANFIPAGTHIVLQSENGLLGIGPFPYEGDEDPDLINAGKQTITEVPGSLFSSADSFAMIRGGHIDCAILGDAGRGERRPRELMIPGKMIKGMEQRDGSGRGGCA